MVVLSAPWWQWLRPHGCGCALVVLAEEGLCGAAGGWRLEAGGYSVLLSLFHQTVFSEIPSLVLTTGKAEVSALHTKQELVLSILVVLGMEETALHSLPFLIVRLPPAHVCFTHQGPWYPDHSYTSSQCCLALCQLVTNLDPSRKRSLS